VFGIIATVLLITTLLVPWRATDDSGRSLTSYSAAPGGTRGLHDVLDRLGFTVERSLIPFRAGLANNALYVVLEPIVLPTTGEVHALLDAVRAGARLLILTPLAGGALADSLGIARYPAAQPARLDSAAARDESIPGLGFIRWVLRSRTDADSAVVWQRTANDTAFFNVETDRGIEPMLVGLRRGRGRVVVASHSGFFRNADIRDGPDAVRAVRLIEWLLEGDTSRPIVFDEYHHGYGVHADLMRVTRRTLVETAPGRVLLQIAGAGLLLLLAIGTRPVRPRPRTRIERRSPLEHVGALARAYAAVHATDRAVRLLVRGIRRRHGGGRGGRDETAWLRTMRAQIPAVEGDIERVLSVLEGDRSQAAGLTTAIVNIERAILS
jgi:hypothetical protein